MSETNSALKPGDILLSKNVIQKRAAELAEEISREYRGDELVIVGVLKGAVIFMSDLARLISDEVDVRMDFLAVSSYGAATSSSGVVKIMKDMDAPAEGHNILLVEDIMDTGLTLSYLKGMIGAHNPKSLKTCVLLEKPERKEIDCAIEYSGFSIPDKFVVGYGLDYGGKWRNLPDIWSLVEG